MKCPACNTEVSEKELVQRKPLDSKGFQLSSFRLVCPHCQEELGHDLSSWVIVEGGFIVWVLMSIIVLTMDLPKYIDVFFVVLGSLVLLVSTWYRHQKLGLRKKQK